MALTALLTAWVMVGLVVVVVVMRHGAEGIPGSYSTFSELQGKYIAITNALQITRETFDNCTSKCQKHKTCNIFAYSGMEGTCILYAKSRDLKPVKLDNYNLFVQLRDEKDGFYLFDNYYIKLMTKRMTMKEAAKTCDKEYYGTLAIIDEKKMNGKLEEMLRKHNVFYATIGVTDEAEEGKWVNPNGHEISYNNWNWKGVWKLKDRNCVTMKIDGTWIMSDCHQPDYFFCQVPLF